LFGFARRRGMGRYIVRGAALLTALLVVLTVLVLPLVAMAQRPVQVRRIAFLGFGSPPSAAEPRPVVELTFRTLFSGSLRVFEECPSSTLRLAIENHSRACR
jgi:hypothetical protein